MNRFSPADCLFVEIGSSTLRALHGKRGLELPLERLDNGRLSQACLEAVASGLRGFLDGASRRVHAAVCALSTRGLSVRRFALPQAARDEPRRLLSLQMEREFPLVPEDLAWTCWPVPLEQGRARPEQAEEFAVAALKREVTEEYSALFAKCGLTPLYTLAALARQAACPSPPPEFAILNLEPDDAELAVVSGRAVISARTLSWNCEEVLRAWPRAETFPEDPEDVGSREGGAAEGSEGRRVEVQTLSQRAAEQLASVLSGYSLGRRLYLTGKDARLAPLFPALEKILGARVECERVEIDAAPGRSAATVGLKAICEKDGNYRLLEATERRRTESLPQEPSWRWPALAALLLLLAFAVPYGEAFMRQPALGRRLAGLISQREGLPAVDREFAFLEYLQTNQPPFLDTMLLLANSAALGTRLDSVLMTRRGDLSLRGSMLNAQHATEFRSNLISSGFFSSVVLDEQTPTPDRQKITFRMSAQVKPQAERPAITPGPPKKTPPGEKPPALVISRGGPPEQPQGPALVQGTNAPGLNRLLQAPPDQPKKSQRPLIRRRTGHGPE